MLIQSLLIVTALLTFGTATYPYLAQKNNAPVVESSVAATAPIPQEINQSKVVNLAQPNGLYFEDAGIYAPLQYMTIDEYFTKDKSGKLQNKTPDETDKVLQPMLLNGAVHLPFTVQPGAIGNSYIIGNKNLNIYGKNHFDQVKDYDYATAFKNLDQAKVGQLFYIHDAKGEKLTFKVFEITKVKSTDTDQAYKQFDKPVVTLQTFSNSNFDNENLEKTDEYLLVRGELQK